MTDVHVIVPVHDSLKWIDGCIASLYGQTLRPAQVTVVDDASRDHAARHVASKWPEAVVVRRETAGGYAAAANVGAAGGPPDAHVMVLNVDTELEPDCLERLVAALDADASLGVVGPRLLNTDGSVQPSCHALPTLSKLAAESVFADRAPGGERLGYHHFRAERSWREVTVVGWLTGAALLVRGSCWHSVGGMDPRYRFYCEEIDLQERIARQGAASALVPQARLVHHGGKAPVPAERFLLAHDGFERYFTDRRGRLSGRAARALLCVSALTRAMLWSGLSLGRRDARAWAVMFWRVLAGSLRRLVHQ